MKYGLIMSALVSVFAMSAHAATSKDLKLSGGVIELQGSAPAGTEFSALVMYAPDTTANQDASKCKFADDDFSPNGSSIGVMIQGKQDASGKYSLQVPLRGLRKSCKYLFNNIYFSFKNGGLYENLRLGSDSELELYNEAAASIGQKWDIKDFKDVKAATCDFASDVGICHYDGDLSESFYHVSTQEQSIQFDVLVEKTEE